MLNGHVISDLVTEISQRCHIAMAVTFDTNKVDSGIHHIIHMSGHVIGMERLQLNIMQVAQPVMKLHMFNLLHLRSYEHPITTDPFSDIRPIRAPVRRHKQVCILTIIVASPSVN